MSQFSKSYCSENGLPYFKDEDEVFILDNVKSALDGKEPMFYKKTLTI